MADRTRSRAGAVARDPPASQRGIRARREGGKARRLFRAPYLDDVLDGRDELVSRQVPWVVLGADAARKRPEEPSAEVRSGYVAANTAAIGPPSQNANNAARSQPTASITARTSSIRVSIPPSAEGRSDNLVPRLSNRISRAKDPSRSRKRA